MAFSTLYAYLRQQENATEKRSDAALKRYESTDDARAWSMDSFEKSICIQGIVKRSGVQLEENAAPTDHPEALGNIEESSREDLIEKIKKLYEEIKIKDVELDAIHKIFKSTSKKLENMNSIITDNRRFESLLKDSREKIEQLTNEKQAKEERLKSMKKEMEELKCGSAAAMSIDKAWQEIENKAQLYDEVVKERNALKNHLCKMVGVEDLLRKLKARADEADRMEQELHVLKVELQRRGAAGDVPSRVQSACRQCQRYANEASQAVALLEAETRRNVADQSERNFLRERVRAIDVMEAELILYKTKYEEAQCKLMVLKETLVRAQLSEKQIRNLKQQLATTELQLKESERNAEDLVNVVERQELELKERDIYIESFNRRFQQEFALNSPRNAIENAPEGVVPGKVRSIIRQLSITSRPTNCKCNIENCECLNLSKTGSDTSKQSVSLPSTNPSTGLMPIQEDDLEVASQASSTQEMSRETAELIAETDRLQNELLCDEVRLLRQQNDELDKELKFCKREHEKMLKLISEVEQQRDSNATIEQEAVELRSSHAKEIDGLQSSFQLSICQKDDELCEVKNQLKEASKEIKSLNQDLKVCSDELYELRPLRNLQQRNTELEENLRDIEEKLAKQAELKDDVLKDVEKYHKDNVELMEQISKLQEELQEQRKLAQSLADQLSNRKSLARKSNEADSENREIMRKCLKNLKKHYDALKLEKVSMIQRYEKELQCMISENEALKCKLVNTNESLKGCEDGLLIKTAKFGLGSLAFEELVDLHNRVRCTMMTMKVSLKATPSKIDSNYTTIADAICMKYNLSDALPLVDPKNIPVKDTDTCSSKTFPSMMRPSFLKLETSLKKKSRARSSEATKNKTGKCVNITR